MSGMTAVSDQGGFVAALSHRLRTNLNTVLVTSSLARSGVYSQGMPLPSELASSIIRIEQNASRINTTLSQAFLFLQAQQHLIPLCSLPVSMSQIIDPPIRRARAALHHAAIRPIDIASDWGAFTPVVVRGDVNYLGAILDILLTNAGLYNKPKGQVIVRAGTLRGDEARWTLAVSDTGIGLTQEELAQAGRPFWRSLVVQNTIEGTGLGLAIARELVRLMRGTLVIQSPDPSTRCGTVVTMTFPRVIPIHIPGIPVE